MVNKLVIIALLALAVVVLAERQHPKTSPISQKMLDAFPVPKVPLGYVSTNPHSVRYNFRTRVDHFNPQNRDTFEFEYYSNDEYYQRGGPIFIFVGGNWPLVLFYIENGHFHDIAKIENAWLFTNEHRYFGNSFPVSDLTIENMRFLTVEQTMVDLAEWIHHLRHNVVRDDNARVVLLGTGYAGSIATWMRQRYPHLVDGAWVSSGLAEARLNFKEYAVELGEVIREYGSDECYSSIWRAVRTAENLIDAGLATTVTDLFNTCEPINTETMLDVETFFLSIKETISTQSLLSQTPLSTVVVCNGLTNGTEETDLHTLATWIKDIYFFYDCLPFDFNVAVEAHRNTENDAEVNKYLGLRQRAYQLCTEFGWFTTADAPDQPFGYRITMYFFLNFCKGIFGDWVTGEVIADGVHLTNMHFGGQNPRISNVVFTNGGLDPVRDISVTEYHQPQSGAIVIPGYFTSADMASISGYNSPALLQAKYDVQQFIESWIWEPIVPYNDNA